jgi:hypothetical protein
MPDTKSVAGGLISSFCRNIGVKTIEETLENAIYKAGGIAETNHLQFGKVCLPDATEYKG